MLEGSLLTADRYMPYRNEFQMKIPELDFGQPVDGDTSVIFIANKNLQANSFGLKGPDKEMFAGVIPPGKSAHVLFVGTPK